MLELLNLLCSFAVDHNFADQAFIVGGAVRDLILGRPIKDADVVIPGDAVTIGRSFAETTSSSFVLLDKDFGITRVVKAGEYTDISAMRGSSIFEDLSERDLTINAMAIPLCKIQGSGISSSPIEQSVVDPFGGRNDLRYGIIRMVSEDNIIKDPLRLLRIFRFAAELTFTIEVKTAFVVKSNASLISHPAAERIAEELRKIMQSGSSYSIIKEMEKSGLLFQLFPELSEYPADVWRQVEHSYGYIEHILHNLPLYFPSGSAPIENYISTGSRIFCLKIAALFGNEEIAEKISHRLRLSRRESDFITMLTPNRALPHLTKPQIIRMLRDFGDDIYALLIHALATEHVCQLSGSSLLSITRDIVSMYQDEFAKRRVRLPLITGDDLMNELGLQPSPMFKQILSQVELFILEGRINSRAEALDEAKRIFLENKIAG